MKRLLVVFKKNHEEVHDNALRTVISVLEEGLQAGEIQYRTVARESVSREDFIGPDVVIVLGGDGTLTSIAHSVDDKSLVMGSTVIQWREMEKDPSDFTWAVTPLTSHPI
mgnify:CR=1 FL=1